MKVLRFRLDRLRVKAVAVMVVTRAAGALARNEKLDTWFQALVTAGSPGANRIQGESKKNEARPEYGVVHFIIEKELCFVCEVHDFPS